MSRSLLAVVSAGLFTISVQANEITMYFGRPETVPPTSAFVADSTFPGGLTQPLGAYTLGLWANVQCDISDPSNPQMDVWNGISLNVIGSSGVVVSNLVADNHDQMMGT